MRAFLLCGLIAAWSGLSHTASAAAPQKLNIAGLEVAAWLPESPGPVLVFSHAFSGCNTQSSYLMEALAEGGYAVFAPNHRDSACAAMMWPMRPEAPFLEIGEWNEATFRDRRDDIERLLTALSADPRYCSLDWQHIAIVGHSLGGYVALGLAGAWESWRDPRVKAVLALSPYTTPFVARRALVHLAVPVMYQGGTIDINTTPILAEPGGAFDQSPAPKYFVEFEGAGHRAFTDLRDVDRTDIIAYSLAFLDRYLKGKPFPPELAKPHTGVSAVKINE